MNENKIPEIYRVAQKIAFAYSILLIIYSLYQFFFYEDGTWLHGFIANGFAILSGLIWISILLIFKRLLNIINFNRANKLLNTYVIFLAIVTLSTSTVLYKSIQVYATLGDADSPLTSFASSSILGGIMLLVSSFAIILICILLGNRIRKVDLIDAKLFKILGFSFMGYAIISLLVSLNFIPYQAIQYLFLATLSALIGMVFKKVYTIDSATLSSLNEYKKMDISKKLKKDRVNKRTDSLLRTERKKNKVIKTIEKEQTELPEVNLDYNPNKELILSYYKDLPQRELSRLENIVRSKYNQNLTNNQVADLIKHYIAENKLYDHSRFLPK